MAGGGTQKPTGSLGARRQRVANILHTAVFTHPEMWVGCTGGLNAHKPTAGPDGELLRGTGPTADPWGPGGHLILSEGPGRDFGRVTR